MAMHFYSVTFDLENSASRTNDYKAAEIALKTRFGSGNYWKIVKQCCIVRTTQDAVSVRQTLEQRLGVRTNILGNCSPRQRDDMGGVGADDVADRL